MPQLTLEYTRNLTFDVQSLLARLHSELAATGAINLKGIKSRAVCQSEYRIADGNNEYAFVHVDLLIREGRSITIQKNVSERILEVLKEAFAERVEHSYISLSVNLTEMRDGVALTLHNIPDLNQ